MRGNRGGRGPPRNLPSVPTIAQVIPGAAVNIVLKEDQPTGRTVSGTVSQLLTRGNHPRGIKVRLSDGRVGRVQSLGSAPEVPPNVAVAPGLSTEAHVPSSIITTTWNHVRDVRLDVEEEPPEQIGLDAYIRPAKTKNRRGGKNASKKLASRSGTADSDSDAAEYAEGAPRERPNVVSATITCPVCDAFKGDEAAVAHHVAGHFDGDG